MILMLNRLRHDYLRNRPKDTSVNEMVTFTLDAAKHQNVYMNHKKNTKNIQVMLKTDTC